MQVSAISPLGNERFLSSIEVMTVVTKEVVKHWQIHGAQSSAKYLGSVVFPSLHFVICLPTFKECDDVFCSLMT